MNSILRKAMLIIAIAIGFLSFQSSANATYRYSQYGHHSYHHSYGNHYQHRRYHRSYRHSHRKQRHRHRHHSCRYKRYSHACRGKYKKPVVDLKPIARSDVYSGQVGEPFAQNVITENDFQGDAPATSRLISGTLPQGLTLQSDGTLSGTPSEAGEFNLVYKLIDKDGDIAICTIKITIEDPNLLPQAIDDEYSVGIDQSLEQNVIEENDIQGDGSAVAEQTGGQLPTGIELLSNGQLSGTPTESGIFIAEYTITDEDGDQSSATITITVTELVTYCPQAAVSDDLKSGNSQHALWIPEISKNLQFVGTPTANRTLPNGDMQIVGTVQDGDIAFDVVLNYSGFSDTSDNPKLELDASSYVENGGIIDPTSWDFYDNFSGTFTGVGGEWEGVVLSATLRGPSAQIGVGANGKNGNFGLSNWFNLTIDSATNDLPDGFSLGQTLSGDVNIDLPDECPNVVVQTLCAIAAPANELSQYSGGHAFVIFDTANPQFVFDPAGEAQFFSNGDLVITGSATNESSTFDVTFEYSDPTSDGTPKLELIDTAYVDFGGTIDPELWSYFDSFTATFEGTSGELEGVVLSATIRGSLPQIGDGASGKNEEFGLSNWLDLVVIDAPDTASVSIGDTFRGDININLKEDCSTPPPVDLPVDAVDDSYRLNFRQALAVNILDNDELGDEPTTITFDPADLPDGFTLDDQGNLSGSGNRIGTFEFPYTITDVDGDTDTATVTIVVTIIIG